MFCSSLLMRRIPADRHHERGVSPVGDLGCCVGRGLCGHQVSHPHLWRRQRCIVIDL